MNESRHVQLMYDKFRRYRKREEDKVAVREAEVKRAGNVDALEAKVQERGAQLSAVEREVVQKEKVSTGLDCTDWPKVGSRGRASLHAVCSVCASYASWVGFVGYTGSEFFYLFTCRTCVLIPCFVSYLCLSVSLSVSLSFSLSVSLCVHLPACLPACDSC